MTTSERVDVNPVPPAGGYISTRIVSARPSLGEAFVPPPAADTLARIFIVVPWTET